MTDYRSVLERAGASAPSPDLPLERVLRRRDRKRRDQRIRAGVVGIAVAIAVGWLGVNAIRSTPPRPADDRSEELGIFAPVAGRIVYMNDRMDLGNGIDLGYDRGLWAVDPNGPSDTVEGPSVSDDVASTLVPLDLEEAPRVWPRGDGLEPLGWSSDGTELLVTRWNDFEGTYYVLHADGTETRLNEDPKLSAPQAAISPDGSRVVFEDEGFTIVDVEGGRAVKLPSPAGGEPGGGLTFSPDGTQIAYLSGDAVWVVNADGSDAHEIVADGATRNAFAWFSGMQWSPAGDRIAIGLGGDAGIYTFAPDGSDFRKVISGGIRPFWSPDGSQIAYTIPCEEQPNVSCPIGSPRRSLINPQPGDPPAGLAIADADGSNVRAFGFAASGPWHPRSSVAVRPEPTPVEPEPEPILRGNGEVLVFERLGTGPGWDLAAQDPETGEVRKVVETDGIVDCTDPSRCTNVVQSAEWSSDGRWVAFDVSFSSLDPLVTGPCGSTAGVWVQSALGDARQLTTPCDATPGADTIEELWRWSPVGDRLVYARIDGEIDELFVIDAEDGRRTSLGTADVELANLAWSPDGTRIAFSDGGSVYVVEVEGDGRSLLADSFEDVIDIEWSPDGTQILVHDLGRYRIQVMDADGSDLHPVFDGEDACCSTAWSPNGDRILYMLSIDRPGEPAIDSEVWTVSPEGSNRIKIFDSDGCDMGEIVDALPVWAPNGTQVAYYDCGTWVVANADGTGEAQPIDELVWRSWGGGGLAAMDLFA